MKKFLSLVLALVMTMSLVTVAGASFTDADDVNYDAAVEVMNKLEVVGGYADGSFNPDGTLTRGAAAKIICNILVGPETASSLAANTAPYSDVPVNHTFAGYIAYCAEKGIISGYADGTFRPAATLTGYAFVKMLLTGLGYDQTIEGYTGTNWAINVAEDAVEKKLTDGLDGKFVGNKAITREEACLFALNALMAKTVKYENKGSNIVIGGVEINTAAGDAKDTDKLLKDTNFESLTKITKDVVDSLGRPSVTWKYEKKEVGTYAADADYTYVNEFDEDVYDDLVKDKVIDGKEVVYYNGSAHKDYKSARDLFVAGKAAVNGFTIEMFDTDDNDTVDVIAVTEQYFAEVGKFTAANAKKDKPAEVVLTVYEQAHKDGKTLTIVDDEDKTTDAYDMLAGYEKGDYVAVTLKQGWETKGADGVLAVSDVEAVSGKVEKLSVGVKNYLTTVKIGGTVYGLNNECVDKPAKAGAEGTLYLDAQGCVLGWVADKDAVVDYAIAVSDVYTTLADGKLTTKVEGYLSNGETTSLTLAKGATAPDAYKVYTYDEKDDTDTYTFSAVTNTTNGDGKTVSYKAQIDSKTKLLNGAYFADGVKFIFVDGSEEEIEVKDGVQKIEKETQVYYTVSVDDGKSYVTAVYVMDAPAGGTTSADDLIFIAAETGAFSVLVDDEEKTFYSYEAYINGEEVEDFYSADEHMGAGFYKNVVDNKTGAYILKGKTFSENSDLVAKVNEKVDTYAADIVDGTYGVADAVVVDLSDSFDGIEVNAYISMIVDKDTNEALYVYVTETAVDTTPTVVG